MQKNIDYHMETRTGVRKLLCRRAYFRLFEYLAGQSKFVAHVASAHKQASKVWRMTVFIQNDGEDLFFEINTFQATILPKSQSNTRGQRCAFFN